jgi:alkylation response protein AidB-like acyl-CoA dehydrogenase
MDFRFSEEHEFFRTAVRDVVNRLIRPRAQEIDEKNEFPLDLWKEFAELGYLGLRHPEKYGGMEADVITSMILYEELARGSCGFAMAATMQILMGTYFVGRFGSEEIKQNVLVPGYKRTEAGYSTAARCGPPTARSAISPPCWPKPIPRRAWMA